MIIPIDTLSISNENFHFEFGISSNMSPAFFASFRLYGEDNIKSLENLLLKSYKKLLNFNENTFNIEVLINHNDTQQDHFIFPSSDFSDFRATYINNNTLGGHGQILFTIKEPSSAYSV